MLQSVRERDMPIGCACPVADIQLNCLLIHIGFSMKNLLSYLELKFRISLKSFLKSTSMVAWYMPPQNSFLAKPVAN